jgi:hypothetical protein
MEWLILGQKKVWFVNMIFGGLLNLISVQQLYAQKCYFDIGYQEENFINHEKFASFIIGAKICSPGNCSTNKH